MMLLADKALTPLRSLAVIAALASPCVGAEAAVTARVAAADARLRFRGNIRKDGTFSFWTNGLLGDWFIAPTAGSVTLRLVASGKTIGREPPTISVQRVTVGSDWEEVGRLPIPTRTLAEHRFDVPVQAGFFGLRLRHTNRVAGKGTNQLRHLVVKELRVVGARRSPAGLTEHAFFGARPTGADRPGRPSRRRGCGWPSTQDRSLTL